MLCSLRFVDPASMRGSWAARKAASSVFPERNSWYSQPKGLICLLVAELLPRNQAPAGLPSMAMSCWSLLFERARFSPSQPAAPPPRQVLVFPCQGGICAYLCRLAKDSTWQAVARPSGQSAHDFAPDTSTLASFDVCSRSSSTNVAGGYDPAKNDLLQSCCRRSQQQDKEEIDKDIAGLDSATGEARSEGGNTRGQHLESTFSIRPAVTTAEQRQGKGP
ncbi:hypothetical protein VTK73DRAFT_10216 [Phialemonium thermophilum]|uniref:Uncharacterized protein n=1 Tax=Phialemonium thermophilum TaxID=223376 RepID=A0ABR3VXY1_9PEZI